MNQRSLAACALVLIVCIACGGTGPSNVWTSGSRASQRVSAEPAATAPSVSPGTAEGGAGGGAAGGGGAGGPAQASIPQPNVGDLQVQPDTVRVDLEMPTFSDPTNITNPLLPVSRQASVLLVGTVDDQPFRTEVTLLPNTRLIEWAGQRVEVLVSQYVAFLGGRIHEVAYDYYAQADDGSVWYFGEDVFNFADGAIVDTHGTWIAGTDGPAAMIMPGTPRVGDVYRPENIPGLVFEEVTVKAIGERLEGPFGPIEGGLRIEELHMDGVREDKSFAPGYGEFFTGGNGDVEALAMAVPTDTASTAAPAELETLRTAAHEAFEAAGTGDWPAVTAAAEEARGASTALGTDDVPALLAPILAEAVAALEAASGNRATAAVRDAAIEVIRTALDLQLRYRPTAEVDLARLGLWLQQLDVDAQAEDIEGIRADFFAIDYVRDRVALALAGDDLATVNADLEALLGAIGDGDFEAVTMIAKRLRGRVGQMQPALR